VAVYRVKIFVGLRVKKNGKKVLDVGFSIWGFRVQCSGYRTYNSSA
jgi:hypothetical protein